MMWRFRTVGSKMAWLKLCVSIYVAVKMLGKETAVCAHRDALGLYLYFSPLNWKEFSSRINLRVSISPTE